LPPHGSCWCTVPRTSPLHGWFSCRHHTHATTSTLLLDGCSARVAHLRACAPSLTAHTASRASDCVTSHAACLHARVNCLPSAAGSLRLGSAAHTYLHASPALPHARTHCTRTRRALPTHTHARTHCTRAHTHTARFCARAGSRFGGRMGSLTRIAPRVKNSCPAVLSAACHFLHARYLCLCAHSAARWRSPVRSTATFSRRTTPTPPLRLPRTAQFCYPPQWFFYPFAHFAAHCVLQMLTPSYYLCLATPVLPAPTPSITLLSPFC